MMSHRGSVLVLVVWTTMLLAVLAAALGVQSEAALSRIQRVTDEWRASAIARAGVQHAIMVLKSDPLDTADGLTDAWNNRPDLFQNRIFDNGTINIRHGTEYGLLDEDRKLNLNAATEPVLTRLL